MKGAVKLWFIYKLDVHEEWWLNGVKLNANNRKGESE